MDDQLATATNPDLRLVKTRWTMRSACMIMEASLRLKWMGSTCWSSDTDRDHPHSHLWLYFSSTFKLLRPPNLPLHPTGASEKTNPTPSITGLLPQEGSVWMKELHLSALLKSLGGWVMPGAWYMQPSVCIWATHEDRVLCSCSTLQCLTQSHEQSHHWRTRPCGHINE